MAAWKWVAVCVAASLMAARAEAGGVIINPVVEYVTVPDNGYPSGITAGPLGDMWFSDSDHDRVGRIGADLHVDEFDVPRGPQGLSPDPASITVGPDNNLWFLEVSAHNISRITLNGTITQFPLPSLLNFPLAIASGPDDNLWFTESAPSRGLETGFVGHSTLNGTVSEVPIDGGAFDIVRGPDDAMWFTSSAGIGRISTNSQYHVLDLDHYGSVGVTSGPDGALWFTYDRSRVLGPQGVTAGAPGEPIDGDLPLIGRITTDGMVTPFLLSDDTVLPLAITRGPEDNLWFTTANGGIWRINLAGTIERIVPLSSDNPADIIRAGADGRIWFTQPGTSQIGRFDSLSFLPINLGGSAPLGLARGADDSIWFADYSGNRIGRIDPNGGLAQHEIGDNHSPTAVAVAPDGSAWFTNAGADTIGHITTDGDFVEIVIPSPPSNPQDIVLGPDGNFWFTEYDAGAIGRLTMQGSIKRFTIPNPNVNMAGPRIAVEVPNPLNITVGPDANLWFTDCGLNKVGRITPSGEIVEFPIPIADSGPAGITAGADGNLYFVESTAGRVARITTAGAVTELGTPDPDSFPQYITLGPDGAIWFTESDANRLGRIARDGRISKFELPTVDSGPNGIIGRGDGRLFVGLLNTSQILYTDLAAAEPTHTVTPTASITRTPTSTRTATATLTVPPGSTATATPSVTLTPTVTLTVPPGSTATATPQPTQTIATLNCFGDCNGDTSVSISELIAAVNIALGNSPFNVCVNADADRDGEVRINDLIAAVTDALQGCPL